MNIRSFAALESQISEPLFHRSSAPVCASSQPFPFRREIRKGRETNRGRKWRPRLLHIRVTVLAGNQEVSRSTSRVKCGQPRKGFRGFEKAF